MKVLHKLKGEKLGFETFVSLDFLRENRLSGVWLSVFPLGSIAAHFTPDMVFKDSMRFGSAQFEKDPNNFRIKVVATAGAASPEAAADAIAMAERLEREKKRAGDLEKELRYAS